MYKQHLIAMLFKVFINNSAHFAEENIWGGGVKLIGIQRPV